MAVSDSRSELVRTVILPALVGLPSGYVADILTSTYRSRGYLSPEYYAGQAFELQLVIILGSLLLLPLAFDRAKKSALPTRELCGGVGAYGLLSCFIAFFHGFLPVMLILIMFWLWTSLRWQRLELTAFRLGIWMCMGTVCGAMAGAITHSVL